MSSQTPNNSLRWYFATDFDSLSYVSAMVLTKDIVPNYNDVVEIDEIEKM